ncbi:hypothetical protein MMC34_005139 [Xylographa carneopallida]|nr:hypothetical protein [Xylographa carneopallida]
MGYLVADNASNNDTLGIAFENRLAALDIPWNSEQRRLRCNDYVVDLAVMAFLSANTPMPTIWILLDFRPWNWTPGRR